MEIDGFMFQDVFSSSSSSSRHTALLLPVSDSSVVHAAAFNPVHLELTALYNPHPIAFFPPLSPQSQRVSPPPRCLPPCVFDAFSAGAPARASGFKAHCKCFAEINFTTD